MIKQHQCFFQKKKTNILSSAKKLIKIQLSKQITWINLIMAKICPHIKTIVQYLYTEFITIMCF